MPIAELFVTVGANTSGATTALNGLSQQLRNAQQSLQSAGSDLTKAVTAPIVGGIVAVGKFGADFEQNFADVKKTVNDLNEGEMETLRQGLLALSKSSAGGGLDADQLAGVAADAGALGIAGKDILSFVGTTARLVKATDLAADTAGEDMARIATFTKTPIESYENLASAVVGLGNEMKGKESEIVETAVRSSAALSSLGVNAQDALATASAAVAAGLNPEAAGTAITKTFFDMAGAIAGANGPTEEQAKKMRELNDRASDLRANLATAAEAQQRFGRNTPADQIARSSAAIERMKRELSETETDLAAVQQAASGGNLEGFANVAGVTQQEFADMFKSNPTDALRAFIFGLKKLGEEQGPTAVVAALDKLGITEARQRQLILGLVNSTDDMEKAFRVATDSWNSDTAALEENRKKQETVESQFQILKNTLKELAIEAWPAFEQAATDAFAVFKRDILPTLEKIKTKFDELGPEKQQGLLKLLGLLAAVGPVLIALSFVIGLLTNPLAFLAILMGVVAALWIANWEDIQGKVGSAVSKIRDTLNNDFGGALKAIAVAALVAAAIIGRVIAEMAVRFIALATTWLAQAARMAVGWLIAAGPAALMILAIAGIITAVQLLRHAWDSNWNGMQEKVAPILELIAQIDRALANFQGFTPQTRAAFQSEADTLQALADQAKQGASISPPAPVLDMGEQFIKQLQDGFPGLQGQMRGIFNQALLDTSPLLGPGTGLPGTTLNNAGLNPAGGQQPTVDAGLARVGGFTTTQPVTVTINNPVVFDTAMIEKMNTQAIQQFTQALIQAEAATDAPPDTRLPGQPFVVPGA